ncbi:MAG: DUF1178 family protein [Rhodobacteraceae bacterium]|nr:DUF1178 family protein [Paracoccaceae bacterium]
MIKYTLKCEARHRFEAWFPNSDAYPVQRDRGLISCPECGSITVEKALMTPGVVTNAAAPEAPAATPQVQETPPLPPPALPAVVEPSGMTTPDARMRVMAQRLRAMRAYVEATSDYVGGDFADEARRIHDGDADARSIYGEVTPDEAEALLEEGVPCAPIPWIEKHDDS